MTCDAHIRPMIAVNDTQIDCELDGDHDPHRGTLRDYAYPGSSTEIVWHDGDRRTFHGDWPGRCAWKGNAIPATTRAAADPDFDRCTLPAGHRGNHSP